jgi:DNA-binding response OmpR family regulator
MKILLAEDDPFFQNFYSRKLLEHGFEVDVAHNGEEAINKISSNTPDVVLLDLIMPGKNGFEVLSEVSKNEASKKPPIIVFSTLGQKSDIEKATKLGAVTYINKTFFDFDNLLSKVTSVLKN